MGEPFNINNLRKFRELHNRYFKVLVMFAARLLGDNNESEDIVQDTFARIWERRQSYKNEAALRTYLFNAVRNRALDLLSHRHVVAAYNYGGAATSPPFESIDDDSEFFTEEVYRLLFQTIDSLPERQRATFLLSMKGKRNSEIAKIMGVSIETVKNQKHKALATLRVKLGKKGMKLFLVFL